MLEPLGLLAGPAARAAVAAGVAAPLDGGRLACTVLQDADGGLRAAAELCGPLTGPSGSWAGLPHPAVMGIVNVTPDSFSGVSGSSEPSQAIGIAERHLADGADLIDVGGESTRPGADPVPHEEEQRRVLPVVAALARAGACISVDTRNAGTMRRALDLGARVVNDVSALTHDPESLSLVAERRCPVILMHMRGTPQTMATLSQYGDVAREVLAALTERYTACVAAGIDPALIAIDPGFGFAKTKAQSRELLRRLPLFLNLPCPIIVGLSRKGFVEEMAGATGPAGSGPASVAAATLALGLGASVLRVHDVGQTVAAVRVWRALFGEQSGEGG